jgi:putative peptidoglycan lipid II flippase
MLSGLGQGIVSAFNYGKQLAETPNLFLTLQFSSVTGIKMNELNAAGDTRGLNAVFLRSANFLSFALVPAAFFLAAFSGEIIAVLYMRGNFGSKSAETTAMFLAYFALLLPMLGINTIIARLFMATQRIRDGMLVQIASNLLIIAFVFYGIKLAGPAGYPLALVMFYLLYVAAMAPVLRALYPWLEYGKTLSFLAKTAVINTAAFALIIRAKEQTAFLTPAGNIAFWFAVCASAALWLNHKFNFCPDARDFAGKVFGAMRK